MDKSFIGQIQFDSAKLVEEIVERLAEKLSANRENNEPTPKNPINPLDEYIPKKDVRGELASSSTLWKYEKEGKLIAYGVGGKRYYRREDIERLFKPIKSNDTAVDFSHNKKRLNNGK